MAFIFGYSNLVAKNNSGDQYNKVDMTADWIVVDDGSGNTLRVPMTTTVTIDKNTAQTSTEAFRRDEAGTLPITAWYSKWVYIWAIYNPVTNTIAGLFSLNDTSPTLPSGYTHKALVGAVYNAVGGSFGTFSQVDNKVARITVEAPSVTATTYAPISLAAIIPPTAKTVAGWMVLVQNGTTPGEVDGNLASTSAEVGHQRMFWPIMSPTMDGIGCFRLPVVETQTVYGKVGLASTSLKTVISQWEY